MIRWYLNICVTVPFIVGNFENKYPGGKMERKIEEMFLVFSIVAFDVVPAGSKYNIENTCDRQSMFQ